MGKRPIVDAVRDGSQAPRHSKRPRIHTSHEQHSPGPSAVAEQVTTTQDLQEALLFDQSSTSHLRSGKSLLCFRARAVQGLPLQVLACSSDSSTPSSTQQKKTSYLVSGLSYATISIRRTARYAGEKEGQFLHNLTQAWDFAAETNCEPLLSQVTAALALLFKVFASHNDFPRLWLALGRDNLAPGYSPSFCS